MRLLNIKEMWINSQVIKCLTSDPIALRKHLSLYEYVKSCVSEAFTYKNISSYLHRDAKIIRKCQ
jgi:hypothetical protein